MRKTLTKAEEDIMQIIWSKGRVLVSDILDELGDPRPPHSTISSIVRILEKKGFVGHKAYGRTYEYFALLPKEEYSKHTVRNLIEEYFGGSANSLVSFLVKEKDLSLKELAELMEVLRKNKNK
ncbi:MAG TPA: BlaI/MecI/CopY family transcriptional regulator [Saprospiraceae bacterium]|nr:BlaI/MecI/CopY family transcriptional regulator [Saprospiraceae bacterium]HNT21757.1 BlaI/MecI/CopY family transcriptional regulator [Saprospiraceae bacterium]